MMKTLFVVALLLGSARSLGDTLPLFSIVKDVNQNVLHYSAEVDKDCKLNLWHPVSMEWELGNKAHEKLSFFEQGLYGFDFDDRGSHRAVGQIKAFKNRHLQLVLEITALKVGEKCVAQAKVINHESTDQVRIDNVSLTNFQGLSPKKVTVAEHSITNDEPVTQVFTF